MKENTDPTFWGKLLAFEGIPEGPSGYDLGKRVRLGDGLGRISSREKEAEDNGSGHSRMCPINLGVSINRESVDQPNDRPVERGLSGSFKRKK